MMWIYRIFAQHLRWSAAVLKKFFCLVPAQTLAVVILTLVSQFAKLLAFFLPLKVIILIGSTGIPRYFPPSWAVYDREVLVVALSVATISFFCIYLIAEKLLSVMVNKGAAGVVERSRKLTLFSNQDELASQAYQKLASGLATVVLSVLLGIVLAILYPSFLVTMVTYVLLMASGFSFASRNRPERRIKLQDSSSSILALLSGLGFLLLFSFMVVDFLFWEGVSFMVAIISLLLSRQLLSRFESVIKNAIWLHKKKRQINAVFFTGHRLERGAESVRHRKFWELLSLRDKPSKLLPLLLSSEDIIVTDECKVSCLWRQGSLSDILLFEVGLSLPDGESRRYLLKIFSSRRKKAALNEADLLTGATGSALPSPELLGVDQFEGFDAHLFRWPGEELTRHDRDLTLKLNRLEICWQVTPEKDLVTRYQRSHPLLYERLSPNMLPRLIAVASLAVQHDVLDQLACRFEELLGKLRSLPLVVTNRGVPNELMFTSKGGDLLVAHWGSWALEPVGADFPIHKQMSNELERLLAAVADKRDILKKVPVQDVRLCAYCNAFEKSFNQQKYADVIELIPKMLDCLPPVTSNAGAERSDDTTNSRAAAP